MLVGPLGYRARRAVPLNLAVSLATILTSLIIRSRALDVTPLAPLLPVLLALIAGAMLSAFFGTGLFQHLSEHMLERVIQILLLVIGLALLVEAALPSVPGALLPTVAWIPGAVLFGLGIGMVSSLLGVAGGEVIIPTLIFAYGVDIKTAGTASLLVSLPTVLVGLVRHWRRGAYTRPDLQLTVAPMAAGSVIGAVLGGLLVGLIAVSLLKALLGAVLIISAVRMFQHSIPRDHLWLRRQPQPDAVALAVAAQSAVGSLAATCRHALFSSRVSDLPGALCAGSVHRVSSLHAARVAALAVRHPRVSSAPLRTARNAFRDVFR